MTPEQTALLEKADESIKAAQILVENNLFDIAISRAYYAMFYLTEAILLIDGLAFSKHSAVESKFGELFAKTGRVDVKFHKYLRESQSDRHTADYRAGTHFPKERAEEHITHAEAFLQLAETMLQSSK